MDTYINVMLTVACVVTIYLVTLRGFWTIGFCLGALWSMFSMLASIFHFQILAAIGFFVLGVFLWGVAAKLAEE